MSQKCLTIIRYINVTSSYYHAIWDKDIIGLNILSIEYVTVGTITTAYNNTVFSWSYFSLSVPYEKDRKCKRESRTSSQIYII